MKHNAIHWTDEMLHELRSLRAQGASLEVCAKRVGVALGTVFRKARELGIAGRMHSGPHRDMTRTMS